MLDDAPILRLAARILLIDAADRLLLLRWKVDDGDIWITPGGGLNPDETFEAGALRELWEETGLSGLELSSCIWMRTHLIPYDGKVYKQQERFFVVRVDSPEISHDNWDELEREMMDEHRWWSLEEIQNSSAIFAPRTLGLLLPPVLAGQFPEEPFAIPV